MARIKNVIHRCPLVDDISYICMIYGTWGWSRAIAYMVNDSN